MALRRAASWLVFPVVMGASLIGAALAMEGGVAPVIAVAVANVLAGAVIIVVERLMPHERDWLRPHGDFVTDLLHTIVSMVTLPELVRVFILSGLVVISGWLTARLGFGLWPSEWPLLAQLPMALVIAEFGGYWSHRLMHEVPLLWRLHAVHHSAPRLYWLNAGRFHPLDALFGYFTAVPVLIALGAGESVIGLFVLFTGVHGLFQHANIELRLGPLNWIFSMAELHRWHHSRTIDESNTNFGANLIVWDIVFGTRFLPSDREPPADIGIAGMSRFPTGYLAQLASPFRYEAIEADQPDP